MDTASPLPIGSAAPPADVGPAAPGQFEALWSVYADRPAIARILGEFVGRLPGTVQAMEKAVEGRHTEDLARLAHQMKGTAGSYGYPWLTIAAGALEKAVNAGQWTEAADEMRRVATLAAAVVRGGISPPPANLTDPAGPRSSAGSSAGLKS
jgi:HPt (histidine-containing phosphotransfer) domain-containing protein